MWMYCLVSRELVASYSEVGVHKERKWCELLFRVWWGRGWSWMSCCLQPLPCRRGAGIGKKLWAGQRPICNGGFWDPGPEDKHSTGLGWRSISLCLHCIQGFKKEGTAPRDPGQKGHECLHGQQSAVRGQARGLESRDCSFTQSRLHQYPAEAFQGMPEPRQWASITEC